MKFVMKTTWACALGLAAAIGLLAANRVQGAAPASAPATAPTAVSTVPGMPPAK